MDRTPAEVLSEVAAATRRDRAMIASYRGGEHREPAGDQLSALIDAVRAIEGADVPFALIGGIAVGIHAGVPRATMGVDLAVSSRSDRGGLVRVLVESGFTFVGEFEH